MLDVSDGRSKRRSSLDDDATLAENDVQPSQVPGGISVELAVIDGSKQVNAPAPPTFGEGSSALSIPVTLAPPMVPDFGPPPDGGMDAWMVIASTTLVLFAIFGLMTSFGQLMLYYLDHQLSDYSKSTVSWISSIQSALMFMGGLFSGRYYDSHGIRTLLMIGTAGSVGALVAVAFCKEYYQFFLAHMAFGLSGGLLYSPCLALAGQWFLRRRSTVMGIIISGPGIAGVIYPVMIQRLLERLRFRDTILIVAGMNAFLLAPSWIFMKGRLPPPGKGPWKALLGPWRDTPYTLLVIGAAMFCCNFFTPYFHAPLFAQSSNLPDVYVNYAVVFTQIGSFFGRLSSGFIADRFGVWKTFFIQGMAAGVTMLAFWTPHPAPPGVATTGMLLLGLTNGGFGAFISAACATISPLPELGMRLGMVWTAAGAASLIGPFASGQLIAVGNNTFRYAAIFCGATYIAGTFIATSPKIRLVLQRLRHRDYNGKGVADGTLSPV